jgi:lipopolysaccharide transport system permease protein
MIADSGKPKQEEMELPSIVIRPLRGWLPINLKELWAYRELLFFFIWRNIKIYYRQAVFGFAWAIIQPLFMMIVFSLFFGTLAKVPSGDFPYPLFSYAALVPWVLFASAITRASNSLIQNSNLIQKVYFPRLLMPLADVLSPVVDFLIAFIILIGMMFYFGYYPTVIMLMVPVFLILELMLALGMGLWLSAINVEYRDFSLLVPLLIQLWLFASPVIYSVSFVPERFHTAYALLNPMVGIIEGFRWTILGTEPPGLMLLASTGIIIVILISGAFYFRRREKSFADVV